jgi:EAL domain-containing protein (putative c-di-GMP-specific phosphodiesterase class I)
MHNAEESIGVMRQLKSMGVGLSLDDFGTGYSSLSYLKRFPIDVLKIDKSFVRDIPEDANDLAIVSAIIAMAHALGLKVIAEGVETNAQWHFLRDCGTQLAQGYYFGRPLPATDLEGLLGQHDAPAQGISGAGA